MTGAAAILHADLDAFFASVEQRDDPRLRGRPVIVGAGVVLAASYEARACGVRTAMPGGRARRLCPQAVVVSPRMAAYSKASRAVYEIFEDTSPVVEGLSIDEAFLDVRGMEHISGTPAQIAAKLRLRVLEQVGLPITVGVARTKFLAKVASGVAKPNGLLVVPPERELAFLHPLAVERLWGVGPATAIKLHRHGITHRRRGRSAARAAPGADAGTRHRTPPSRPRAQPRPAAGACRAPPRLDRRAARPGPIEGVAGRGGCLPDRAGRARVRSHAGGRTDRPHSRSQAALRRLRTDHAIAHAALRDRADGRHPDRGAHADDRHQAGDRAPRPHAGGGCRRQPRERRPDAALAPARRT